MLISEDSLRRRNDVIHSTATCDMSETPKHFVGSFTTACDALQPEQFINEELNVTDPLSLEDGRRFLHVAATEGNVDTVQMLLNLEVDVNVRDYQGNTALHYATRYGHVEVVSLLLHKAADTNLANDDGCSILQNAVCFEHLEIMTLLLSHGANLNATTSNNSLPPKLQKNEWHFKEKKTLLAFAFELGNVSIISELMLAGADVTKESHILMYIAIQENNIELVNMLLEREVDVERECIDGKTPLNVAICRGLYNLVKLFIDLGAKVTERLSLLYALRNGHLDIAKFLIERGAESSIELMKSVSRLVLNRGYSDVAEWLFNRDSEGLVSQEMYIYYLVKAIKNGNIDMVFLIIGKLEDIDARTGDRFYKETALISATKHKLVPVIELLLEKGAEVTVSDTRGNTALFYAIQNDNYLEIFKIFLKWGVSVNELVSTRSKHTALHQGARYCRPDLVEYLLLNGADVNVKDVNGNTPFHLLFQFCIRCNNLNLIKQFLDRGADLYQANNDGSMPINLAVRNIHWLSKKSSEINLEQFFVEECFEIVEGNFLKIRSLLCDIVQKQHISLVKLALHKTIRYYYEVILPSRDTIDLNGTSEQRQKLLDKRRTEDDNNIHLLHAAAYKGDVNLSDIALQRGENVDSLTKEGFTALQIAMYKGNTSFAQHLIDKGANLNIEDRLGLLPFHVALLTNNETLATQMYPKTCRTDSCVFGVPLLHLAVYNGSVLLITFLLSKGFNINTKDKNNNSILHTAVRMDNHELVDFLLENGIDKNAQDASGDTALHIAFREAHYLKMSLDIPQSLLRHDVDINITNSINVTALHHAASTPLASLLLEKGVRDINTLDAYGSSPFHCLASYLQYGEEVSFDPTAQVVLFLKHNADISKNCTKEFTLPMIIESELVDIKRVEALCQVNFVSMTYAQITSIFRKINYKQDKQFRQRRQYDLMEILFKQGFSLNVKAGKRNSLLDHVMKEELTDVFKLVLENDSQLDLCVVLSNAIKKNKLLLIKLVLDKMDLNARNNFDISIFITDEGFKYGLAQMFLDRIKVENTLKNCALLVQVAKAGNLSMTKTLLDKGVYVNSVDAQSNTALHYAAASGNKPLLLLLITRGAHIDLLNMKNEAPINLASATGQVDAFKLLLNQRANLLTRDIDGNTLLHKTRSYEIAHVLINRGVQVNDRNSSGRTALHCVADPFSENISPSSDEIKETPNIATLLIESGAAINARDTCGLTALHLAAMNNQTLTTTVLVENKADIDLESQEGLTALQYAVVFSRNDIVEYLLNEGALTYVDDKLGHTPLSMFNPAVEPIFNNYSLKENLAGLPSEDTENRSLSREEEASCLEELDRLRLTYIHDNFCLFEILSSFQNPTYLFNEQVVQSIERAFSSNLLNNFPNYRGILKSTYARSKKSKCYLIRQALKSIFVETRRKCFRSLPVVVWLQVLKYLSREDLENFIESESNTVSDEKFVKKYMFIIDDFF